MSANIGTELEKIKGLHRDGVLSDNEFETAKAKLLGTLGAEHNIGTGVNHIGRAANRWVDFNIATYLIGAVIAALAIVFFFIPMWNDMQRERQEFDAKFKATEQRIEQAHHEMAERRKQFDKDFDKQTREMDEFRRKNFPNQ